MIVEITPDVQGIVLEAVGTGAYANHQEVVAAALRAWNPSGAPSESLDEQTGGKLQEALDRRGPYFSASDAYSVLRDRYREWQKSGQDSH